MYTKAISYSKKLLAYLYAGLALLLAIQIVWAAYHYGVNLGRAIFIALLLWWAVSSVRLSPLALKISGALSLLLAVFFPLAILNPFAAGDYLAQGLEPPGVAETMYWLVPLEIFLLAAAYVFDYTAVSGQQAESDA